MTHFIFFQNITPLLFAFEPVAVMNEAPDGWYWELHFDTNDFLYRMKCDHSFPDPFSCDRHLNQFCEKNQITLNKKEF